jgi:hypothetical protein
MAPHQRDVTERCSEQQVGLCAPRDEEPCDLRAITNEMLRRCGLVVVVARVDLGAVLEQKSRDLDRAREMQRPLAVAAFGMDEGCIACDQSRELRHHAEIGRRPDVDPGTAGNQRRRLVRADLFEHAEAALLPAGPGVEIGAVGQQEIEQREIGPRDMHGLALEGEHRRVDHRDELGVRLQQLPHVIDIARFDGSPEQVGRRFGQRFDLSLQMRPAGEAIFSRDHELRIAQDKILWRRRLRVRRMHPLDRLGRAPPIVAREGLRELSLHVEIRIGWKRADETLGAGTGGFIGHDRPLSHLPGVHETGGKRVVIPRRDFGSGGRFPSRGRDAP